MTANKLVLVVFGLAAFASQANPHGYADWKRKSDDKSRVEGMREGAEFCSRFVVLDDLGVPVPHADVRVWAFNGSVSEMPFITGCTDSNGVFLATIRCRYRIEWVVEKKGYYPSFEKRKVSWTDAVPAVKDGKWQPYGADTGVRLKKIRNPHGKMMFQSPDGFEIPAFDSWLSFDLEEFDWVKPYGNGVNADVLLKFWHEKRGKNSHDYYNRMEVSFTNNPFAGTYVLHKDLWSRFQSVYEASTNMDYQASYVYEQRRYDDPRRDVVRRLEAENYLVFRTRTQVDAQGRLISAHYGKLYGPWFGGGKYMKLKGCFFNEVPNDVNLETDPHE